MNYFLLSFLLMTSAFAGFEGITIKNLDLNYEKPYGKGEVEKVSLRLSSLTETTPFPVHIERTDRSFVLGTPYFDFEWINPLVLLHDTESARVKGLSLVMGHREHKGDAKLFAFKPAGQGEYTFEGFRAYCGGNSISVSFEERLMMDCRDKLEVISKRVDVPADFPLVQILMNLPKVPNEMDVPADDLKINVNNGKFTSAFYFRYYVYAGLRAWGNVSYSEDLSTIIIKVDQIRWGYLPVTGLVMRELKKRVKHPKVSIDGHTVRITKS